MYLLEKRDDSLSFGHAGLYFGNLNLKHYSVKLAKLCVFRSGLLTGEQICSGKVKVVFDLLHHSPPLTKQINYDG